ncbi:hypothetical protein H6F67_26935 [Microcoleus sp. FACHB-1515]|uniref:hypothetical protein n=1 Tax=Cyanophyceae TaxID=3028117 RepID=UPI001687EB63|nr:hypothetical protein [Microcoleus sp. FACHB-1515]MBD2093477.1 hypothetical protein [Microcoleus sp. FACHB-1515]
MLLLIGLLNLGLGLVIVLGSFLRRPSAERNRLAVRQQRGHWLTQALQGGVIAVPLYALSGVVSLVMAIAVVENGLLWWYNWQMPQVELGDSRERVEQILGQPGWHSDCNDPYARSYSQVTDLNQCQSVSLYYQMQGSKQWEIAYNAQDRVVSKQYFQRDS